MDDLKVYPIITTQCDSRVTIVAFCHGDREVVIYEDYLTLEEPQFSAGGEAFIGKFLT